MQLAVMILMIGVVGALVYAVVKLRKSNYTQLADHGAKKTRDSFEVLKPCPLCGTMLRRGERVHSVVFSGGQPLAPKVTTTKPRAENGRDPDAGSGSGPAAGSRTPDYLTHIFGCPYCHPANTDHPRECPVCNRTVPKDGYVIARMFDKPGRKHVHVLGCTRCRKLRR